MTTHNDKEKIIQHYNIVSPYYFSLWGNRLHHGYWVTGNETKEEAQLALTKHLADAIDIKSGSKILDIGYGFGTDSIYLAKRYNSETTGITISSVQVKMAKEAATKARADSRFFLMDAEAMSFDKLFDVAWSVESISHYKNKADFFMKVSQLLEHGGTLAIMDWFKKESLSPEREKKYILPIEKGMMVDLHTINNYESMIKLAGLQVVKSECLNKNVAKTWDISLDVIKDKKFWQLALKNGKQFISFLRAFNAMKSGFSTGSLVYGMIIAKKS